MTTGAAHVHLILLILTATCHTAGRRQRSAADLDSHGGGGGGGGMRSDGSHWPATNIEMHIAPIARRPDSVVPPRYYIAPHNINLHPYRYIINNPNLCIERQEVFLLMMVRTTAESVDRRMAIRDTWAASFNLPGTTLPVVFLLGAGRDRSEQKEIDLENRIYRDIIQEDFLDTTHNLTLKSVMAFKWAHTYCPHAEFVMVADDDVVVDIYKMVSYLQSLRTRAAGQFTLCYLYPCCMLAEYPPEAVEAPPESRDYDIYIGHAFPAHCSSSLFVATSSVVERLYLMSLDTPSFVPDAAWIGVLADKLGLAFGATSRSYAGLEPPVSGLDPLADFNASDYLATPLMVGVTSRRYPGREATMVRRLWKQILAQHRDKPPLDVSYYMRSAAAPGRGRVGGGNSDRHIYQVALAALLIDLAVMASIGYVIFCRRRPKMTPYNNHNAVYQHQR